MINVSHIDNMMEEIEKENGKVDMTLTSIRRAIDRYWKDKIAIVWGISDIIDRAKEKGYEITEDEASEILDTMQHNHDASIGINWSVIDEYLCI